MDRKHVVLIGAGHTHLHVAANTRRLIERDIDLTLIDPGRLWYSGMAAGMLAGHYQPDAASIDPEPLVTAGGGRFIRTRVEQIDREAHTLNLETGDTLSYDLLSINIGSEAADARRFQETWKPKPIPDLLRLRQALNDRLGDKPAKAPRVLIVGGGSTGCEIAANIGALTKRRGKTARITLLSRGDRLMETGPAAAARSVERVLRDRYGVTCRYGVAVTEAAADHVVSDTGEAFEADFVVAATGLRASGWIERWGLGENGMPVDASLCCTFDPSVFGGGDCIAFGPRPLPKIGVFGVRQGPILLHNLIAAAQGEPLRTYRPQKKYLTILNLGEGIACAIRGRMYWTGRASARLKDWIDRRFIERYR